jgi:hypothetical protein
MGDEYQVGAIQKIGIRYLQKQLESATPLEGKEFMQILLITIKYQHYQNWFQGAMDKVAEFCTTEEIKEQREHIPLKSYAGLLERRVLCWDCVLSEFYSTVEIPDHWEHIPLEIYADIVERPDLCWCSRTEDTPEDTPESNTPAGSLKSENLLIVIRTHFYWTILQNLLRYPATTLPYKAPAHTAKATSAVGFLSRIPTNMIRSRIPTNMIRSRFV